MPSLQLGIEFTRTSRSKYIVKFAFVCDGGNTVGTAEPKTMNHRDLEFALGMVDPFNHGKWMGQIGLLRRRGDHISITMSSASDSRGEVVRIVKVEKI